MECKKMQIRGMRGFSMVELVIILAIIVGLAGVVVPIVSQEVKDSQKARAIADINRIATGVNQYIKDTLFYPTGNQGSTTFHYLYSEGNIPQNNIFATGEGRHLDEFLGSKNLGGARWKGPYLQSTPIDPWGNAYIINVEGFFNPAERAMILSAGPDGVVNTTPRSVSPAGDDLMLLID
jgi:general secretion pathway protein G